MTSSRQINKVELEGSQFSTFPRNSGRYAQGNASDHQIAIPFQVDASSSLVTHIQATTPQSTPDRKVVILIARKVGQLKLAGSVLKQCATNEVEEQVFPLPMLSEPTLGFSLFYFHLD